MPISLNQLAAICDAQPIGGNPEASIYSATDITSAQPGQVTQLTNSKYLPYLKNSLATGCFVGENFASQDAPEHLTLLVSKDPEISFIKAVEHLHPVTIYMPQIAPQAIVDPSAHLEEGVYIGPYAVIGAHARIGAGTVVLPGAYIGNHVKIGQNCHIHPYAVIYDHCLIGEQVIIHSGAIIGADGFGYKFREGRHLKVPQVGNVVVGDFVEIGANTCVDRGALGSTVIGEGSKIDNLVQVGHNNKVGKHVIMCGLTGVSGSCQIEDYAILAGASGIADHVKIGQGAVVLARSGVANDVPAKSQVFGSPAKDKKTAYKEQIALAKLPDLLKRMQELEEQVKALQTGS